MQNTKYLFGLLSFIPTCLLARVLGADPGYSIMVALVCSITITGLLFLMKEYKQIDSEKKEDGSGSAVTSLQSYRYMFFDTETNSLKQDRVALQLAWILTDEEGNTALKKTFYLKRDVYIEPGASQVNHITNELLKEKGVSPVEVYKQFVDDLSKIEILVAHNYSFDIQVLRNDFQTFGLDLSLLEKSHICTMLWSKEYVQAKNVYGSLKNPRLEEMAGLLLFGDINHSFPKAHDALFDSLLTKDSFFKLKQLEDVGMLKKYISKGSSLVKNTPSPLVKRNKLLCSNPSSFLPNSVSSSCEIVGKLRDICYAIFQTNSLLQERVEKLKIKFQTDNVAKFMHLVTEMSEDTIFSCDCEVCKWHNISDVNITYTSIGRYKISFLCNDNKGISEKYETYLEDQDENAIDYLYKAEDLEKEKKYEDAISCYLKMLDYPCDLSDLNFCAERLSVLFFKLNRKEEALISLNRIIEKLKYDYAPALSNVYVKNTLENITEKLRRREKMPVSETAKVFTNDGVQYMSDEELDTMDLSMIFQGKKVLITGNLFGIGLMVREEGNELIQKCGGIPQKNLVKSLDFVIIGADFGPAKMAQIIDRQNAGTSMKCLTPIQFKRIVSALNVKTEPLKISSGKTIEQLSFEMKTLQKYTELSKQAIANGKAFFDFTQEEFDYLKKSGLLDDSMISGKK